MSRFSLSWRLAGGGVANRRDSEGKASVKDVSLTD